MTEFVEQKSYYAQRPVALVIGCGDMGMGSARALGRRQPLVLVDIDRDRLAGSVESLRHEGYTAEGIACDIADADEVRSLADAVNRGPGVRVLAHIAAVGNTPGRWRHVMRVDLIGAFQVAQAIGPALVRGGAAVFVSSTGSRHSRRGDDIDKLLDDPFVQDFEHRLIEAFGREPDFLEAYYMAKYGVNRLARKLAVEWGAREVRALSVSPGLIDSTMGRTGGSQLPVYDGEKSRVGTRSEKAVLEVPLRRQGTIQEIVSVIDFVASDAASYLNGIDIPVDGGSTAAWYQSGVIP